MPDDNQNTNSQTLVIDLAEFDFETLEQDHGQATVVGFQLRNHQVKAGDVLLILSGAEILFHGLIGRIDEGRAIATDRRGSLLPASVQ
jgi:hypothetical protein